MTLNSEAFEVSRWHSPEYVESWMADLVRESGRQTLRKKLVSLLPLESDAPIRALDLGAGAGGLGLEILGTYPNASLVCLDFSEAMLAHARRKLMPFAHQVTFVQSDLRDSSWVQAVEGGFDAIVCSFVVHTIPARAAGIYREVFGLLAPGGCLLAADVLAPPGPVLEKAYLKARLKARQAAIKAETGIEKSLNEIEMELSEARRTRDSAFPQRARSPLRRILTLTNHLKWLSQAGFDEVDCLWKDMQHGIIGGFKRDGRQQLA